MDAMGDGVLSGKTSTFCARASTVAGERGLPAGAGGDEAARVGAGARVSPDQLDLEQQRPRRIDGDGEGGVASRGLRAVASSITCPMQAPSLARMEGEAARDIGVALRDVALRLPDESSYRAELLESSCDYLTFARLRGVAVPAASAATRLQAG